MTHYEKEFDVIKLYNFKELPVVSKNIPKDVARQWQGDAYFERSEVIIHVDNWPSNLIYNPEITLETPEIDYFGGRFGCDGTLIFFTRRSVARCLSLMSMGVHNPLSNYEHGDIYTYEIPEVKERAHPDKPWMDWFLSIVLFRKIT
jgi:hypothetical protein